MPKPFYENNGKALNREDIDIVLRCSADVYYDDHKMLKNVGLIDMLLDVFPNLTPDEFLDHLNQLNLEICIDENDLDNYLLLKFKR